jgi:uncharacterized protein with ParB-like and HNH nuclease domain
MDEPKSLDSLFKEKIFRIPDYQRGYAWQRKQLKDFWEDLINLSDNRSHYTGVLTLNQIPSSEIATNTKEYWLVEDHSYKVYHVVDGQQRLATFIIFLQAFVDFMKGLPESQGKTDADIYITESLNVAALKDRYLFKAKPTGDKFRTYKFGYTEDNPSYNYLRFRILGEEGGGSLEETFYTLNLSNAKDYFTGQLSELYHQDGRQELDHIYKKLTKRFLFNEYVIKDEFDVFVAFETMNNRGKKLSNLELLKNRLIYLTTLYNEQELDAAAHKSLRSRINDGWKEVYHQLGRNKTHPLSDDDFLRAHWTMYFKYSRKTGKDYIRFLLDEQFTTKKVYKTIERPVTLEVPEEIRSEEDLDEIEEENEDALEEQMTVSAAQLAPTEIRDFVLSLKESAVYWFRSFFPHFDISLSPEEHKWIDRLNRIGIVYFRPLIMSILKNVNSSEKRIQIFKSIERFIFIAFRMNAGRANYGSSEFYNAARELDRGEVDLVAITKKLNAKLEYTLHEDGTLRTDDFYNLLFKKFKEGSGYYGWSGLRYFLYEYELDLLSESIQKKVDWNDLLKSERDRITIEHVFPQTETEEWAMSFVSVEPADRKFYSASLGNLLLLSSAINSSLQNDSFSEKKHARYDSSGKKIRNGYSDGSHSEIEVSAFSSWGAEEIKSRGIKLLKFMETRWDFRFKNDTERERLLFLNFGKEAE